MLLPIHRRKLITMRYVFHLFLILAFFSCKKDDDHTQNPGEPPPPPADVYIYEPCDTSTGVARASKLGNAWIAGVVLWPYESNGINRWSLYLTTCYSGIYVRENITIGGFPDDDPKRYFPIIYKLAPENRDFSGAFYSTMGDDGDVLLDHYRFDTTAINTSYLEITRWDNIARIAEGNFHVAFRATRVPTSDPKHYEFMEFSDGRFWAKIPE